MDGGEMKKLLILAILLIPAMVWGEWVFLPPVHTGEDAKSGIAARWERSELQLKRVSYSKTGSKWTEAKEMALITKYVNQALKENPGWVFFQFEYWVYPKFEIIIYLQQEVDNEYE